MNLSPESRLLLAAARLKPGPEDIRQMELIVPQVNSWDSFTVSAIRSGLGPLAWNNLKRLPGYESMPAESRGHLMNAYYRSLSRNMMLYEHFSRVVHALSSEGIRVIALKGIYLAETFYRDIGLRQMSDIDLLVRKEDISRCQQILLEMGYRFQERFNGSKVLNLLFPTHHLPPLVTKGISIDLHTFIHKIDSPFSVNIDDYWERAKPCLIHDTPCFTLSPEDLLQHLCIHLSEHFTKGMFQLYNFCDIAVTVNITRTQTDWAEFLRSCKACHCTPWAVNLLKLSSEYFNALLPEIMLTGTKSDEYFRCEHILVTSLQTKFNEAPAEIHLDAGHADNKQPLIREILVILNYIFPDISYMKQHYQLKSTYLVLAYYPVRMMQGILKLMMRRVVIIRKRAGKNTRSEKL